jgi:uncharacterized membrane protein
MLLRVAAVLNPLWVSALLALSEAPLVRGRLASVVDALPSQVAPIALLASAVSPVVLVTLALVYAKVNASLSSGVGAWITDWPLAATASICDHVWTPSGLLAARIIPGSVNESPKTLSPALIAVACATVLPVTEVIELPVPGAVGEAQLRDESHASEDAVPSDLARTAV